MEEQDQALLFLYGSLAGWAYHLIFAIRFKNGPALAGNCRRGSKRVLPVPEHLKGIILILGKMPKVKTNSSAKKRFKVSATGKIMHQKAFKRHILTKKSKKRKRNMRKDGTVSKSHVDFVKRLLRLK